MSNAFRTLRCCSVVLALLSAPATAGPTVFWTFGFDSHYTHGTGGHVELPKNQSLAAEKDPDLGQPRILVALLLEQSSAMPMEESNTESRPVFLVP